MGGLWKVAGDSRQNRRLGTAQIPVVREPHARLQMSLGTYASLWHAPNGSFFLGTASRSANAACRLRRMHIAVLIGTWWGG